MRSWAALAASVVAVLAIGGCGETVIDDAKTEASIERNLEGADEGKVSSVECPSGVEVKAGETFDCTVEFASGEKQTATLKVLNEDADVELSRLAPDNRSDK